jgi:hypothetical protein
MKHYKQELLEQGKTFETHAQGNSMTPRVKNGQKYFLSPVKIEDVKVGDIVFCKVKGKYNTHLVLATDSIKGLLIGNNHGHVNGWTRQVWGKSNL